jgi:hypothetical protein
MIDNSLGIKGVFKIVVAVTVQNNFYLEIHQNEVFHLKKLFLTSAH